ncbi:MAG: CHAT domain-containing protein [Planctomycetota bacterium]|jgi:hypothetical protein
MNPYNIILVFPKQKFDQAETICDELSQKLQKQEQVPRLDLFWNEVDALQRCKDSPKRYDLMITSLDIPKNRKIPLKSAEQRGIILIESMRKNKIGIPCILLAEYKDEQIDAAIVKSKPCRVVETRVGNWESELIIKCQAFLLERGEQDEHSKKKDSVPPESKGKEIGRVDIILEVGDGNICYCMQGENVDITPKVLPIDVGKVKEWRRRSDNVSLLEDWESELHAIGCDLRNQFSSKSQFERHIIKTMTSCGDREKVRIRFVVDKMIHPVAVEALLDENEEYYMLFSPTYRTIPIEGGRPPLFTDNETREKPINCLIIEADTSGSVLDIKNSKGEDLLLEPLENVGIEGPEIKKYLDDNKEEFNIGKIERLSNSNGEQSFLDRMEDILKDGPWHLVHFAGHSYYDRVHEKGYVFVPGRTGPKPFRADAFAMKLRQADTRFVYLSSCTSGRADFVFELAKKQIPSILGFRWDIEDPEAAEHAQLFYENLFDGEKILEYAFFKTRTKMYSRHPDHRIWCAAMLIIQKTA